MANTVRRSNISNLDVAKGHTRSRVISLNTVKTQMSAVGINTDE